MKVTNDKTENSQAFLTIEMEPEEVEESMQGAYRRLVRKTRVPGFRKGKTPRNIFERYIGKETLMEEALNDLLPEVYKKAIEEQEIEAIAQPQLEITQTEPLILKATVPLKPTVELGDYKSIRVKRETIEVTEEKVDEVIEQLRHQHATWEPTERSVELNDLVVLDVEGRVEDNNFLNQKGVQYQVIAGQSLPATGFAEQLVGMNSNEEKEFTLKYPDDYSEADLAGKDASFKVKISGIKQEIMPEINDELAKTVGAEFETMTALRERAFSDMKTRAEEQTRINFEEELVHAVADVSVVEFPPIFVETEINRILNRRFQSSSQSLEDYLATINKTEEELREELRPSAERSVIHSLVLGKLAEVEEIKVSDEEVDAEIENMIKDTTEKKDELKKVLNDPQIRESITQSMITRKTMEKLTEYAGVQEKTKKQKTRRKKKEEGK
jgi:trigger factor